MSAGMRTTRSTFNSKVTLYEPAPSTSTATTTISKRSSSAVASTSSPTKKRVKVKQEVSGEHVRTETIVKDEGEEEEEEKPKPAPKVRAPKPFKNSLDKPHKEPARWREVYAVIENQRKSIVAPVDTMGCEQGGQDRNATPTTPLPPIDDRLSILVSLMLSSQTKDPVTHAATNNLRMQLRGGLTLQGLLDATEEEIDHAICKVGFHNIKKVNLKKLAVRLRDLHDGVVPGNLDDLLAINGVGPKMAFLFLQSIGINQGIGVDTHVHRITNRLGWHKPATTQPEQTRLNLESWLPKELHPKINLMLVGFGQKICLPVGPRCDLCDLAQAGTGRWCPSKRVVSPKKGSPSKLKLEDGVKVELKEEEEEEEEGKPKVEVELEKVEVKEVVLAPGEVLESGVKVDIGPKGVKVETSW